MQKKQNKKNIHFEISVSFPVTDKRFVNAPGR